MSLSPPHTDTDLSYHAREEVGQSIADLHTAGVKVVMVTGDHPLTAEAIGRKIGLITLPSIIIQDDEDFLEKISKMDSLISRDRLSPSQDADDKPTPIPSDHHSDGLNSERLSEKAQKNYAVIVLGRWSVSISIRITSRQYDHTLLSTTQPLNAPSTR